MIHHLMILHEPFTEYGVEMNHHDSKYYNHLRMIPKGSQHSASLENYNLLSFVNFKIFSSLCLVLKILNGLAPLSLRNFVFSSPGNSVDLSGCPL